MKYLFSSSRSYSSASFVMLSFRLISERYSLDLISEFVSFCYLALIQEAPPLVVFVNNSCSVFYDGFFGEGALNVIQKNVYLIPNVLNSSLFTFGVFLYVSINEL